MTDLKLKSQADLLGVSALQWQNALSSAEADPSVGIRHAETFGIRLVQNKEGHVIRSEGEEIREPSLFQPGYSRGRRRGRRRASRRR